MRRLLALVPALMLVFALAPAAQAHEEVKNTPCHESNPPAGGMTGILDAYDSGTRDPYNHTIYLVHRISVLNACTRWGLFETFQRVDGDLQQLFVAVAPGVERTFAHQALAKAGIWQHPYTNWSVHAPRWATQPCSWQNYPGTKLWVLPDGRLSKSPPPECVTG